MIEKRRLKSQIKSKTKTPLEIAKSFVHHDWSLVPIPYGKKAPIIKDWPNLKITTNNIGKYFSDEPSNIGVLLGEPSGGLIDIDLDSPEARQLADKFLPPTKARFGRAGSRGSHRLYYCHGLTSKKFQTRECGSIVEVRSTGAETLFPGSRHPSGEIVAWEMDGEPATVEAGELLFWLSMLAAVSLLVHLWPAKGARNDTALALAGLLLRHGWKVETAEALIETVAEHVGDEELDARVSTVSLTKGKLDSGEKVTGLPRLIELVGKDVKNIVKWLCLNDNPQTPTNSEANKPREKLLSLINDFELLHDESRMPYATFTRDEHDENFQIGSKEYEEIVGECEN